MPFRTLLMCSITVSTKKKFPRVNSSSRKRYGIFDKVCKALSSREWTEPHSILGDGEDLGSGQVAP